MDSRGLSHVELQQPTEPVSDADAPLRGRRRTGEEGDDVVEALMIPLGVVVLHVLLHDVSQASRREPSGLPFSASNLRSASVKRSRAGGSRARRTRFSARRYSRASRWWRPSQVATRRMRNSSGAVEGTLRGYGDGRRMGDRWGRVS